MLYCGQSKVKMINKQEKTKEVQLTTCKIIKTVNKPHCSLSEVKNEAKLFNLKNFSKL